MTLLEVFFWGLSVMSIIFAITLAAQEMRYAEFGAQNRRRYLPDNRY